MEFAFNILALIMVLGSCWVAMMWMSGRFHGHGELPDIEELDSGARAGGPGAQCVTCDGVGASHRRGRLEPCPQCEGTGVLS